MIKFKCKCGKTLRTKDEAAGKRLRCPACGQVVAVPGPAPPPKRPAAGDGAPQAMPSEDIKLAEQPKGKLLKAAPPTPCPNCRVPLPPGSVLCTTCGFDLRIGDVFKPQQRLFERISWPTVWRYGRLAALALVLIALGTWAYFHISSKEAEIRPATTQEEEEEEEPDGAPSPQVVARVTEVPPPFVRVVTRTKWPEPALGDGFTFHFNDGDHTAKSACELLRSKVWREARDWMVVAGHTVLEKGQRRPSGRREVLTLRVELEFAWEYQKAGKRVVPKAPYIAWCRPRLVRKGNVAFWEGEHEYSAQSGGPDLARADRAALAKLKSVNAALDFRKHADRQVVKVANKLFDPGGVLKPRDIVSRIVKDITAQEAAKKGLAQIDSGGDLTQATRLASNGNQYLIAGLAKRLEKVEDAALLDAVVAQAKDPGLARRATAQYIKHTGKAPPSAVATLNKVLVLLDTTRFAQPKGSYASELPVLKTAADRYPHLTLSFAKTAVEQEEDSDAKRAFRQLCTTLQIERPSIRSDEKRVLTEIADTRPATRLGRLAVWTLLTSNYRAADTVALRYLCKVAGKAVPDVAPPWPDGTLRLSESQMEILDLIARRSSQRASEAALMLLLRVGGEQRQKLHKYVSLPPLKYLGLKEAAKIIQSGNAEKVRETVIHGLPFSDSARALLVVMVDTVYRSKDPALRAPLLYAIQGVCNLPTAPIYMLLSMVQSPDVAERRAAAEILRMVGPGVRFAVDQLRAAAEKEGNRRIRGILRSAVQRSKSGRPGSH